MAQKNKTIEKEPLYSVSIGTPSRSLLWCDEHWYETAEGQNFLFTKTRLSTLKENLPKHNILKAAITDENGVTEMWYAFHEKTQEKAHEEVETSEFDIVCEI